MRGRLLSLGLCLMGCGVEPAVEVHGEPVSEAQASLAGKERFSRTDEDRMRQTAIVVRYWHWRNEGSTPDEAFQFAYDEAYELTAATQEWEALP